MNLEWLVQFIAIPVVGGLVYWILRLQTAISEHRVYVAEHYATVKALLEMEARLTDHLKRIERQLAPCRPSSAK